MKVTIYWKTKNQGTISRIREKFDIESDTSVNGETIANIKDKEMELLRETERMGYIQIRKYTY